MSSHELMLLIRPDLNEEQKNSVFSQVKKSVTDKGGSIESDQVWSDKRKMAFDIRITLTSGGNRKFSEALYYLINFNIAPDQITALRNEFKLNDSIMRMLFTKK